MIFGHGVLRNHMADQCHKCSCLGTDLHLTNASDHLKEFLAPPRLGRQIVLGRQKKIQSVFGNSEKLSNVCVIHSVSSACLWPLLSEHGGRSGADWINVAE